MDSQHSLCDKLHADVVDEKIGLLVRDPGVRARYGLARSNKGKSDTRKMPLLSRHVAAMLSP